MIQASQMVDIYPPRASLLPFHRDRNIDSNRSEPRREPGVASESSDIHEGSQHGLLNYVLRFLDILGAATHYAAYLFSIP
jgi:hypothetical protein